MQDKDIEILLDELDRLKKEVKEKNNLIASMQSQMYLDKIRKHYINFWDNPLDYVFFFSLSFGLGFLICTYLGG